MEALQKRNFGLDLFRAIAIIIVVKLHGSFLLKNTFLDKFPTISFIDGVDLFFVLSGFLIGGILLKDINSGAPFGFTALTRFWKRRWFRTLPNYYLVLIANYFLAYCGIIADDIEKFNWKFFVFLQNFALPFSGFFWESWSLSIEEWFYIFSALSLLLFLRFLSPKTSFALTILLMVVLPFLYRASILDTTITDYEVYASTFRKVVLTRLDSIAYGLLAAWVFYYYPAYWKKFKAIALLTSLALVVFTLSYIPPYHTFYRQVILFTLSPLAAMLLLPAAYSIKVNENKITKAIRHISKISYSMYLINLGLIATVIRDNFAPQNETDSLLKYVLFWILVIGFSTLLYEYFEKPMLKLRDKKLF